MTIRITIETDNAAFIPHDGVGGNGAEGAEIARILHKLANEIHDEGSRFLPWYCYDTNGNRVGIAEVVGR